MDGEARFHRVLRPLHGQHVETLYILEWVFFPYGYKPMREISPMLQKVMDDIIASHGSIEAYLEHVRQREKQNEFDWQGLNCEELKNRYGAGGSDLIRLLVPIWDLRRSALSIGDMANQINHETIPLYLAERGAFLRESLYGDDEIGMTRGVDVRFLRVIGNWERGSALTPPLMFVSEGRLWKWDGHHRVMMTLMTQCPVIPFYCNDSLDCPGISRAPSWMHELSRWSALGNAGR